MQEGPEDPPPPPVRISDADRQMVVDVLRRHCAEGRLTLDEFADRVGAVYEAKVQADLDAVTADLPAAPAPAVSSRVSATTTVVGIMSSNELKGRWRAGDHINAFAMWGGCEIDLRGAQIDGPVVEIDAVALMGGIDIIVPEGIQVDVTRVPIMGGCPVKIKDVPVLPGTPLIKIRAVAFWGGVGVRSKPSVEEEKRRREERRLARQRGEVVVDEDLDVGEWRATPALSPPPPLPPLPSMPPPRRHDHARHHRPAQAPAPPAPAPKSADELQRELDRRIARHEERHRRRLLGIDDTVGTVRPDVDGTIESVAAAVQEERPDLTSDAMPDGTVTILFTDIQDSTKIIEALGDLRAQEIIRAHNELVRAQIVACGGHEVKSQGDSFMVSFAGARRGLRCAIGIQRAFADYCDKHPEQPVRVRIGLHTGEAIRDANDLFGKSVVMAARIAAQADGEEILVSALLKELADSSGEFQFDAPRKVELKGLSGEHQLYPVAWREDALSPSE